MCVSIAFVFSLRESLHLVNTEVVVSVGINCNINHGKYKPKSYYII